MKLLSRQDQVARAIVKDAMNDNLGEGWIIRNLSCTNLGVTKVWRLSMFGRDYKMPFFELRASWTSTGRAITFLTWSGRASEAWFADPDQRLEGWWAAWMK